MAGIVLSPAILDARQRRSPATLYLIHISTAHGLFVSVSQIAGILGNMLGGFLFDAVGGKPFYLIAGGVMFLSVLVFALSFTLKRRETAPVPAE